MSNSTQDQYQYILELIDRQDDVLGQIDELNERIESLIKNITDERHQEIKQQSAELNPVANSEKPSAGADVKKAA